MNAETRDVNTSPRKRKGKPRGKKFLAVMLSVALALSGLSATAFAEGGPESLLGSADTQQGQTFTEGTISLDADNAYIKVVSSTLDGTSQVVTGSNILVPTSGDFVFSPQADTGFNIESVEAYKTGDENHKLAITQDASGNSVISANDLLVVGAITLKVATTVNPIEEVAPATAEPIVEEETEEPTTEATTTEAPLAGGIAPMNQTLNGNELTFKVATSPGNFEDVDSIGQALTWPLSTETKQIQVTAKFSDPHATKDRSVTVNVPRGYKILEYSATSGTSDIAGVSKLGFSTTDEAQVASSVLTDATGGNWAAQRIMGYTREAGAVEGPYRIYDGKVAYTFNSNADTLTLTLTLGLDQYVMSHAADTKALADLTVDMQSGTDALSRKLSTTVSGLVVPPISASGSSTPISAGGILDSNDPNKGSVPEFGISFTNAAYTSFSSQNHFAENITLVVGYPEGVTFTGFGDEVTGPAQTINTKAYSVDAATFTSQTYSDGHLTVTLDKVARTVTFEYDKVISRYNASISLFWTAEVDDSAIKWDQTLQFPATYNESSGLQTGASEAHPVRTPTAQAMVLRPNIELELTPTFASRSDLNAYAQETTGENYPYDYLLGGFTLNNSSTSAVNDLLYEFTFSPNLAIRGFNFPGRAGNNYSKVEATTNTGRVIELGPFAVTNNDGEYASVIIDSFKLGLAEDEYLLSAKAWQDSLAAGNYPSNYAFSATGYYGRFQAGQEGDVTLRLSGVTDPDNPVIYAESTGHTSIASTKAGVSNVTLSTSAPTADDGTGTGSFYPNGTIKISTNIFAGLGTVTQESIIDPTVYLALPEGINLDLSSLRAQSISGNHGSDFFALRQVGVFTKVVNGVTWNVYAFESVNPLDMVAQPNQSFSAVLRPSGYNTIRLIFDAKVSSSAPTYTGLKAQDIVQWDLGEPASNNSGGSIVTVADAANVTGKGTSYTVAAPVNSGSISIVQKPGLKISLGIRTAGDTTPYFTYDGTEATVAPLTVDSGAQIWLEYENTAPTAFYAGSEIFLPIPKAGAQYDGYFNDIVANPSSGSHDMRSPAWTGTLTGPITLPGFDTLYSTDPSTATNILPVVDDPSWQPTDISFSAAPATGDYSDVTMVKFVATENIESGDTGETSFVMDVDDNAGLGQVDFWRSFQRGWSQPTPSGVWTYGSVIAATPTMAGIEGMLYIDTNDNGMKDAAEVFDPTAAGYTFEGVLTGTGIQAQNLLFAADGSFKVVDASGKTVHLKPGTYTINFTNATQGKVGFSSKEVPSAVNATTNTLTYWGMDILQADIARNHSTASYSFTVDSSMEAQYVLYMGVAQKCLYRYLYS